MTSRGCGLRTDQKMIRLGGLRLGARGRPPSSPAGFSPYFWCRWCRTKNGATLGAVGCYGSCNLMRI